MAEHYYYSIASGSSGNCGLYMADGTAILIDLGVSLRRITTALKALSLTLEDISAVVLTHEHIDHVKGLPMFLKKAKAPVFATRGTAEAFEEKNPEYADRLNIFDSGERFWVRDVDVVPFPTPHDAAESTGYIFEHGGSRFGFATDLGFVPRDAAELLRGGASYTVDTVGEGSVKVEILDAEDRIVACADGAAGTVQVENARLWQPRPGTPYLYTALVRFGKDEYRQKFGFRSVEVSGHKFLINGAPFYFKGPCKHEDSAFRGRGYDACVTVTDLKLYEWLNANCLRMSHYPYAEEVYDLCDRLGIVVIDETPAVGIGAGPACDPYQTFPLKTYHSAVLRAMIERDKNHPCVVLWSLGNEPDTEHFPESARDYWRPLYEQAHTQDPQDRPVTMVCCQNDYTKDITTRTMDVVCINRYYGWYNLSGDLDNAAYAFKKELDFWETIDKPLILSEYGADTVAGMHGFAPEMFTEEFQVEYYRTINGCLDERRFVVGEWPWNFADFSTQQGPMRVGSCNRKGLFTRERTPKLAAHYFRDRWGKKEPNDR